MMSRPQLITKREMEVLNALRSGRATRDLKMITALDGKTKIKMDRSNLHRYLISLENKGFAVRGTSPICRDCQKGGPIDVSIWRLNFDKYNVILKERRRLRGIETDPYEEFWKEVEIANQEAEWERQYLARQKHYEQVLKERSSK